MLVLLPLRGWLGDAMALERMGQAWQPSLPAATHAMHQRLTGSDAQAHDGQRAALHADCPGHTSAANAPSDDAQHGSADCATCAACQICHAVGLTPIPPQLGAAPVTAGQPQGHVPHFSSAERAAGFKPPIL